MKEIDWKIARIAAANNRVVSWRHLVAAGVKSHAVGQRVAANRLYRLHHGIYLLEPAHTAARLTLFTAAVYACAPNAFLSHDSAAELWELTRPNLGVIHVSIVGRNPGAKRVGIKIHRTTTLTRKDVRTRHKVPTTSPTRTIKDLRPDRDELELLIAAARRRGLALSRELPELDSDPAFTRSKAEQLFLRLICEANLPKPQTNVRVQRFEVDFHWPQDRLIVEIDGFDFHKDRAAFERDRARDAALTAAGYRVIRITWRALTERPLETVARIAQALKP